mmetsp:Transcript_13101/g.41516  ORF Transcript_13101/g.41516 Transcript_13101/m.41516 type:complete len:119 (-) Transcript_13101:249-605(-)
MTASGCNDDACAMADRPSVPSSTRRKRPAEADCYGSRRGTLPDDDAPRRSSPPQACEKTLMQLLEHRCAVADTFFQRPPAPPPKSHSVGNSLTAGNLANLGDTLDVSDKVASLMKDGG